MSALLSLNEAAVYLAMTSDGLRKLVKRRAIRFSQASLHARIKFRVEWLDEWIARGEVEPASTKPLRLPKGKQAKPKPKPAPEGKSHGFDARLLNL